LKQLFEGKFQFDNPKPTRLIKRLLQLATNADSLVLDSFAGSGTTGHAVVQLNQEDGGQRRFILVEMEPHIARPITAERLRRVIQGYSHRDGNGNESRVEGLGGGFRFCALGEPLFDAAGQINPAVAFEDLARYVFLVETGQPLSQPPDGPSPLIGVSNGVAVYLLYNGILKDRRPQAGNVLTRAVLAGLPPHDGPRVVYGVACRLSPESLRRAGVTFRQIPYQLRVR
jgi:site-specific DNA-methyltransferase (adenine-specific)/adenine-specific DNA-methyltransferase